ncbi:unnamed protein product, partial [Meganyctiphanes norvegica]
MMAYMDFLLECSVCHQRHDEDKNRPQVLPCDHTLCTSCTAKSLKDAQEKLVCPFCRKSSDLMNNTVTNFPDKHNMLQILTLKGKVEDGGSTIKESNEKHGQEKDIQNLKEDRLQNIAYNICFIRKHLTNIEDYKEQIEKQ